MDIDTYEEPDKSSSQYDLPPYKYGDESIIVIEDDNDSLLSETSNSESIEIEEIGIPDHQLSPNKNNGSSSSFTNKNLYCNESVLTENEKIPLLSAVSSATVLKPIIKIPNFQSFTTKRSIHESCFKPKQRLQTISSIRPKSELRLVPLNSVNYRHPTASKVKAMVDVSKISKSAQNSQPGTSPKFVARIQKLPGGKYKVIPAQGIVPSSLENVFKRNPQFVKQKTAIGSKNPHTYSNSTHMQQKEFPSKIFKPFDFGNRNRNMKLIPHTITSKDLIQNQKQIVNDDGVLIKTSYQGKHIPSTLYISPKSQAVMKTDGQSISIIRYGENAKKLYNTMQVSTKNKHNLTKSIANTNDSDSFINISSTDQIIKDSEIIKHSNKSGKIYNVNEDIEELSDEDDQSGRFVSCHYQYCHTLVFEPELIDGLYCSLKCKNVQAKQMIEKNAHKMSVVDQKCIVSEIEVKVPKRKHSTISPCLEKMARNNDWRDVEPCDNSNCKELPMDISESLQNVSLEIETPEAENEDNNDLKYLIFDEKTISYIEEMEFRAASIHLFDIPFPTEKNLFKVGQKLEGIDPEHEALFCVLTIVRVRGFRIKLHFDGYSDVYDFWVNADCPDLFYPGWCKENSRMLQPPKNYGQKFDWTSYLDATDASAAPKENFASTKLLANCKTHLFRIGDKLEALDVLTRTLPKQIVCVGTVADILGNRIRIHYDGWADDYDCWMDISSTNIHPIGWAKNNGRSLAQPSGYNDFKGKKPFTWTHYLEETNSKPVPEEAFVPRALQDFTVNTVIEVVDIAYPVLIRVAEILDVRGDELKILYDGFANKYAYWIEDDSPDIHPVGWSIKTNHPIEIPAEGSKLASCNIKGCTGKGNTSNLNGVNHIITKNCPYEFDSWENSITGLTKLLDRLKNVEILKKSPAISSTSETIQHGENLQNEKNKWNTTAHNYLPKHRGIITDDTSNVQSSKKHTDLSNGLNKHNIESTNVNETLRNDICLSFGTSSIGYSFMEKQNRIWTRHNAQLGIPMFNTTDARKWSSLEVATYVDQVVTNNYSTQNSEGHINISQRFLDQEIDGDVFLMLNQNEIIDLMKIPFGHAIKIYSAIEMLRQRVPLFDWVGKH